MISRKLPVDVRLWQTAICLTAWLIAIPVQAWNYSLSANDRVCTAAPFLSEPRGVSDGWGGAILVWTDQRYGGTVERGGDIFAQRMDASGAPLWTANGVPVSLKLVNEGELKAVSDGAGGAIIVWSENARLSHGGSAPGGDIYAQRISASGQILWEEQGAAVCTEGGSQFSPDIVADGSGGAIISWRDDRTGSWPQIRYYAQRVDASGQTQWSPGGVAVTPTFTHNGDDSYTLVPDSSGGAFIAWTAAPLSPDASEKSLFVQRMLSPGHLAWESDGRLLCDAAGSRKKLTGSADGQGGALFAWADSRNGVCCGYGLPYLQRVTPEGQAVWSANGVRAFASNVEHPSIVDDGAGGAIVAFKRSWTGGLGENHTRPLLAQRVALSGDLLWGEDGVNVSGTQPVGDDPMTVSDGAGGAVIAWGSGSPEGNISAQRIGASGSLMWPAAVTDVTIASGEQSKPLLVSSSEGRVIAAWLDARPNGTKWFQLFAAAAPRLPHVGPVQKIRVSSAGSGYQELFYNYSTGAVLVSPYDSVSGTVSFPRTPEEWLGVFHYDYADGRFTQSLYSFGDLL